MTPKYRPDIDGLRAIAVLSVIFFHYGVAQFGGGYIGVDVFFVISGYLITAIIAKEIQSGVFSITHFYERRFRRILPALAVTIVTTLIAGAFLFDSVQFKALAKSIAATALFSSNILFYLQSGYFDAPSALKPLLHTWSLAVEEQYYIIFPLILTWIATSPSKRHFRVLIPLTLISFLISIAGVYINSSATFYLIPTRAWEFLAGGILSIHALPRIKSSQMCNTISVVGLILVAFSIFSYGPETKFPGLAALPPTLGTVLMIYAGTGGHNNWVNRMLSLKPLVFIGLISYSLYLWHWPILVFTKYYTITEPDRLTVFIMMIATFLLAILTWRYIETPFRKKTILPARNPLLITSLITSTSIAIIGAVIVFNHGFPNRYANDPVHRITLGDPEWEHWGACENIDNRIDHPDGLCTIGEGSKRSTFLLWGDSHARAIASAIDLSAKQQGHSGKIATRSACLPLLSIDRPGEQSCSEFNNQVIRFIANNPKIHTVILAGRWALSANGTRYKQEAGPSVRLIDLQSSDSDSKSNAELLETGLNRTIEALQQLHRRVVIVAPIPEVGYEVPPANFIAMITGRDTNALIAPSIEEFRERTKAISAIFSRLKQQRRVYIIDPSTRLCDRKHCSATIGNTPLYRDDDHLSTFGAKYIATLFNSAFKLPQAPE